jgi:hypothetical protein
VKAAALRRVAEDQARAELARLAPEVVPVTNPLELLATLCGEARQWQEICRARRDELGSATYETPAGFELARAEIALWERAIDRVERFATSMARLDIDDRLVKIGTRITEELGTVIYLTVSGVMTDLGHDFSDELVRATCQRRLRAVAADRA